MCKCEPISVTYNIFNTNSRSFVTTTPKHNLHYCVSFFVYVVIGYTFFNFIDFFKALLLEKWRELFIDIRLESHSVIKRAITWVQRKELVQQVF